MIVPVFLPHVGCGQRCTYCNQDLITDTESSKGYSVEERIASALGPVVGPVEAALYSGNPLGLGAERLERLLSLLSPYREKIGSVRMSVRPGPIDSRTIRLLKDHRVSTIEVGTPSFNDRILDRLQRGHTGEDARTMVSLLKEEGFETCMQVMVGLPGETEGDVRETADAILELAPSFIRIYPLLVIENTPLFREYASAAFVPDSLEAAVRKAAYIYARAWSGGIATIKMGLTENHSLKARVAGGPYHPAFGYLVKSESFMLAVRNVCRQAGFGGEVCIHLCQGDVAHLIGYKRSNLERLGEAGLSAAWAVDQARYPGHFSVEAQGRTIEGDLTDCLAMIPF